MMLDFLEFSLASSIRPWTYTIGGGEATAREAWKQPEGRREEPAEQATAPGPGEFHKQCLGGRDVGICVEN